MSKCRSAGLALLIVTFTALPAAASTPGGAIAGVDAPPADPSTESVYRRDGLLGPVRVGPTFGVGAPDGLRFGAFAKWRGVLAVGGAFSYVPTLTVPGIGADVRRASGEAFVRVHPFRGAFFLGFAGGYAQTKGALSEETRAFRQLQVVQTRAYASAVYLAPNLGFQWMLPFGMTAGFDVGVEIPVASTGPTFDAAKYGLVVPVEVTGGLADAVRIATTTPIPVVHLLELGYAF